MFQTLAGVLKEKFSWFCDPILDQSSTSHYLPDTTEDTSPAQ